MCPNRDQEFVVPEECYKNPVKKRLIPHGNAISDWPCRNPTCDNYNFQR